MPSKNTSATDDQRKTSILTTRIRIKPLRPPPGHPDYTAPTEPLKSAVKAVGRKRERPKLPATASISSLSSSSNEQLSAVSLDRGLQAAGQSRAERAARVQKFLTEMADDSVRVNYVQRVDEEVSRSLESAKAKDSRTGKRGNRNKSQQSQLTESKDKIDITSPDSILSHITSPRLLFNPNTFSSLPLYYQYKLVQFLPACDQVVTEQGWIKPSASSLTNEFFSKACAAWFDSLKEGRFTPEYLQRKKQEAEREKAKMDPWKLKHFEPIWGMWQKSQQVSIPERDRIPRILLPELQPKSESPARMSPLVRQAHSHRPRLHHPPVAFRPSSSIRPRPLSKQRLHAERSEEHVAAKVIEDAMDRRSSAPSSLPIVPTADSLPQQSDSGKADLHSEERSHNVCQPSATEDDGRNVRQVPEIKSPEQWKRTALSAIPGDRRSCPSPAAEQQTSSEELVCRLPDLNPVRTSNVMAAVSPDKQMSKESTSMPVSPIRTRSQRKQKTGVMKNSQGIDEQRSINICKKVVAKSANNKLFFVTQRGSIQQLNNEQEPLSQPDMDDSNSMSTPALVKTLPNDTDIFPISNQNHSDEHEKRATKAQLTVMSVNGFRGDQENIPTGLQSSILCTILSNSRSTSDSERLPLSYKLPEGITITPMTSSNSSNQVPVITRTEVPPPLATSISSMWNPPACNPSLSTQSANSDHGLEELTRIPKQITVIPLGPSGGVDLPVEGEGNEDELEMEEGDEVEDVDQMMGSTSSDCVCSLKALIQCSKCGALCHSECIGPSGLCVRCLVRVNNHSSYMQSVPIIANSSSSQASYVYPM